MLDKSLQYYKSINYNIIIKREELDGEIRFVAYCSELGINACHGIGNTETEAIESFKLEKDYFIEYLYNAGIEIPIPQDDEINSFSGTFTVRTSPWLHYRLVNQSKIQGVSLNSYLNQVLSFVLGSEMSFDMSVNVLKELKNDIYEPIVEILERTNSLIYDKNEITRSYEVLGTKKCQKIEYSLAS